MINTLGLDDVAGKDLLLRIANGAKIPEGMKQSEIPSGLQEECMLLRWTASSLYVTLHAALMDRRPDKDWPESAAFSTYEQAWRTPSWRLSGQW